jgi:hypothetical protein
MLDADSDLGPDSAYHFVADPDVDPDPDFNLMRIQVLIVI